jgi:hypothetical protein
MAADPQMPTIPKSKLKSRSQSARTNKHSGAMHELTFMVECMKRGWKVSVPVGEDSRYDVIVDTSKGLSRVQVKTCGTKDRGRFRIKAFYGSSKKSYTWKDCDILAAFVSPLNTWWIIPINKLRSNSLDMSKNYHQYNSAWHLIGNENKYHRKK